MRAFVIAAVLFGVTLVSACSGSLTVTPSLSPPTDTAGHARPLALGRESSCLLWSGAVHCWGEGDDGELGDGFGSDRFFPRPLAFDSPTPDFTALALGGGFGCARRANGALYCWGSGGGGALGNGGVASAYQPVAVELLNGIANRAHLFDTGLYHSCATTADDLIYCWGYNGNGQVGSADLDENGTPPRTLTPTQVMKNTPDGEIASLATGGYHSCIVYRDGSAACWGGGGYGQLGNDCNFSSVVSGDDDTCVTDHLTPIPLPYFNRRSAAQHAAQVAAGTHHTCVVSANGHLFCFGRGDDGRLGVNSPRSHSTPQHVGNIPTPITAMALGDAHSCALIANGEIYCFGDNEYGQLGNRSTVDSETPVRVTLPSTDGGNIAGIAAGATYSCAWDDNGRYYCWGGNASGQLGLGVAGGVYTTPRVGAY